jgi:hypothetical protein
VDNSWEPFLIKDIMDDYCFVIHNQASPDERFGSRIYLIFLHDMIQGGKFVLCAPKIYSRLRNMCCPVIAQSEVSDVLGLFQMSRYSGAERIN